MSIAWRLVVACLAAALLFPVKVWAASPQEVLDSYVDKVLATFEEYEDADLDSPQEKEAFREDLSSLAGEVFAYEIMTRMSLGHFWNDFSPQQQQELVELFVEQVESYYFGQLIGFFDEVTEYSRDMIALQEGEVLSANRAEVRSIIRFRDQRVPVDYRLVSRSDEQWKIYDIVVEGISLIQNYRSQFQDLMRRKSPEELLQMLRERDLEEEEDLELAPSQ